MAYPWTYPAGPDETVAQPGDTPDEPEVCPVCGRTYREATVLGPGYSYPAGVTIYRHGPRNLFRASGGLAVDECWHDHESDVPFAGGYDPAGNH